MRLSMNPARLQAKTAAVDLSGQPFLGEEVRQFLETRLALVGKIGFLFVLAYYVLSNVSVLLSGESSPSVFFADVGSRVLLVDMACCGGVWLVCRKGRLPLAGLRALDAGLLLAYSALVAADAWVDRGDPGSFERALMPLTWGVLARAVLIPSSAGRTAWVSLAAFFPLFALACLGGGASSTLEEPPGNTVPPDLTLHAIRGTISAALAVVTSSVIYGLQRQVRRARQLGQYQLERKVGQGGMGEVYRARHAMLRRPTAVKILRPELAGEESIERFEREVQLTSQLTHPNTIAIYDYGRTPDGTFYYAMEYLEGLNLHQLVELDGPQPPERVIHILRQASASLVEAHENGIVHRDIKPGNIILCERGGFHDVAKVVDFGLVLHVDRSRDVTVEVDDRVTGTPLSMSPESIRSPDRVDGRADIYAVGAVGYFLLTGKPLFESESFIEICSHQLTTAPVPPSERLGKPLPRDLEALVLRCLEKEPGERPSSARELLAALSTCADAGRWDEERAATWWKTRGKSASDRVGERSGESDRTLDTVAGAAPPPTLDIDLESRVESVESV
ncbi:MAG: serine/threonine-protein kinase [Planctomycetota bacterium]|nr:serine/threonine-protein kinase [Planctomycetota bacterium]